MAALGVRSILQEQVAAKSAAFSGVLNLIFEPYMASFRQCSSFNTATFVPILFQCSHNLFI
jgi:hypothetical protein